MSSSGLPENLPQRNVTLSGEGDDAPGGILGLDAGGNLVRVPYGRVGEGSGSDSGVPKPGRDVAMAAESADAENGVLAISGAGELVRVPYFILPALDGNGGKVLFVNPEGKAVVWGDLLPDMAGNAGRLLAVAQGETVAEWVDPPATGSQASPLVISAPYSDLPTAAGGSENATAMAAGNGAAAGAEAIALGSGTIAAFGAVAVGTGAIAASVQSAVVGNSCAAGMGGVAIGHESVSGMYSVTIGAGTRDTGFDDGHALDEVVGIAPQYAVQIGSQSRLQPDTGAEYSWGPEYNTVVGFAASAAQSQSSAFGYAAAAYGAYSTALGQQSKVAATALGGVAMGSQAEADNEYTIAVGYVAKATADRAMVLGSLAESAFEDSVAIGHRSKTYSPFEVSVGCYSEEPSSPIYRRITCVADGTFPKDAVNLGQLTSLLPVYDAARAGMALVVNGAGDGLVWAAAGGSATLPVYGTADAGKVLAVTNDGAAVEWATPKTQNTPFDAAPGWRGATVKVTADIRVASSYYTVPWQVAIEDTDSFWDSAAPAQFTVPPGVNKVRVSWALLSRAGNIAASANMAVVVVLNSATFAAYSGAKVGYSDVMPSSAGSTPVLDVAGGDVIALKIASSDTAYTLSAGSMFQIEVVDPIPVPKTVVLADGSASLALEYALAGRVIESAASADVTYTIAMDPDDTIPVGTMFTFAQNGAGAINVAAASGITLNGIDGGSEATGGQWTSAHLYKRSHEAWVFQSGSAGADGASAYEVAVRAGFSGTEAEWLASLVGPQGEAGADGVNGADGQSVTVIACTDDASYEAAVTANASNSLAFVVRYA